MSGADLLEDGFPHSTPEGYKAGCRGRSCIGVVENGISCADAFARYQGDYGFRKKVDAGMSPTEIVAEERNVPGPAVLAKPRPVEKPTAVPLSEEVRAEVEAAVVDVAAKPPAKEIPLEEHGTTTGYNHGCRLKDACPGVERVGRSCTQAINAYQRDLKAARKKRASGTDAVEAVLSEKVVEAIAEHELAGVDADGELCSCGNHDGSVVEHLAAVALAIPSVVAEPVAEEEQAAAVVEVPLVPSVDELQRDLAARDARIAELQAVNLQLAEQLNVASPPAEVTTVSDGTSVTVVITVQRQAAA